MSTDATISRNPWRNIPRKSLVIFLAAVFFTFANMGIVADIGDLGRQSPLRLGVGIALSGLFAVVYAYFGISMRGKFWKPMIPIILVQIVIMSVVTNLLPDKKQAAPLPSFSVADTARLQGRLTFDSIASTAVVILGYIGFVFVFVTESRRHIRLHTEKAVLESELQAAREVQQVILPDSQKEFPGFHVDSVYKPAQQVGGDFFQILPDGSGGILAIIGDVAGKGLPAAMLVSMLVGSLRTAAEQTTDPTRILNALQDRLIGRTSGGFSTALAAHIAGNGTVTIANAGHLPPYLNGKEIALPGALPLGIAGEGQYPTTSFALSPGSRLTFYTDGVAEARSQSGELFGFDRTQSLSTEAAAKIVEAAVRFGQSDDITVVTIERNAA